MWSKRNYLEIQKLIREFSTYHNFGFSEASSSCRPILCILRQVCNRFFHFCESFVPAEKVVVLGLFHRCNNLEQIGCRNNKIIVFVTLIYAIYSYTKHKTTSMTRIISENKLYYVGMCKYSILQVLIFYVPINSNNLLND
jgi:hypothetical protein